VLCWNRSFASADSLSESVPRAQTPNSFIDFIVFAMPSSAMTQPSSISRVPGPRVCLSEAVLHKDCECWAEPSDVLVAQLSDDFTPKASNVPAGTETSS